MKTKPFDLIAALSGAPVVTRNGCKVKKIGFYFEYPVLAEIELPDGTIHKATFTEEGLLREMNENFFDLFMLDEEGGKE